MALHAYVRIPWRVYRDRIGLQRSEPAHGPAGVAAMAVADHRGFAAHRILDPSLPSAVRKGEAGIRRVPHPRPLADTFTATLHKRVR